MENQQSEELFNSEELAGGNEINTEEIEKLMEVEENDENTDKIEITENTEVTEDEIPENTEMTTEVNEGQSVKKINKNATQDRITNLPIAKIKHIIKLDPEVTQVNAEAVFLITKSTELFIKSLSKESYQFAAQNKKKTITKNHVESALSMLPVEL